MTREEAIERIKSRYDKWALDDKDLEAIQCTFPELAEDEYERIRKKILDIVRTAPFDEEKDILEDWLEKQKEQKPTPKFRVGDMMRTKQEAAEGRTDGMPMVVSIDEDYYICNNEKILITDQEEYEFPPMNMVSKPAEWSEKDETIIEGACNALEIHRHTKLASMLKSLRPQPKQEWSEEDGYVIDKVIEWAKIVNPTSTIFEKIPKEQFIKRLNSLRLQSHWKLSEEQMEALERASTNEYLSAKQFDILVSLYEQLKKLM